MKDACMVIAIAMLFAGVNASVSLVEQPAGADQAQAESKGNDRPAPPANVLDVMNPDSSKSATDTDQSRAESRGIKTAVFGEYRVMQTGLDHDSSEMIGSPSAQRPQALIWIQSR